MDGRPGELALPNPHTKTARESVIIKIDRMLHQETRMKQGRPRLYPLPPQGEFATMEGATVFAALEELSNRFFDLVSDLPQEAMTWVPAGAHNSISMLGVHMIWAEFSWLGRCFPDCSMKELEPGLAAGRQDREGKLPPSAIDPASLEALCARLRKEATRPLLVRASPQDLRREVRPQMSLLQVLMHLVWHWTHHSGQIGLLRRMGGNIYSWRFPQ
jgi:uncharacterized damage-inducible protein DinB